MQLRLATLIPLTCLATLVACSGGSAPQLAGVGDQVAEVGTELKVDLDGTDADGGRLTYGYHAADLMDVEKTATVTTSPSGAGVFRWTPLADDLGQHAFDFSVSDGDHTTTVTVQIDVRSAIGSATAPIFRQPLGTGTTVDMTTATCVDIDVVVEDQDSASVALAQEEPKIEGAELTDNGDLTGKWHWCPTKEQQQESRYTVVLSADDGDNPKTLKNYLVVLRGQGGGASCPGAPPEISHTPADQTTRLDLALDATITDDLGLKDTPLFYYSVTPPADPPDLSHMLQLSMTGTGPSYTATVPNPVATAADGTSKTIYYVFVADDDDDTMGSCDHTTTSQVYQMTVTAGGSSTAGICSTCTADAQCGDGNECVYIGNMGDSYCLQGCAAGCPSGYSCSADTIFSVDFNEANQCVPQSGSCTMPTGTCEDDIYEENDTRSEASANPPLAVGEILATSCPSTTGSNADDDWYKIVTPAEGTMDVHLLGDGNSNLDLHLYHSDGTVVTASTSTSGEEDVTQCLPKATYYVKINAYGHVKSDYVLDYAFTAGSCAAACTDDGNESDDSSATAQDATYPGLTDGSDTICPGNDDWYHVNPIVGDVITVDLTFTQSTEAQDLDVHLYKDGVDLWPCSVSDASGCDPAHGQGAVSNEHATYTVPANGSGDYYVVVRGWDNATNTYGITISYQ